MNGAISSYSADAARRLPSKLALGGQGDGAGLQAGLFEQLLSLPAPMSIPERPSAAPRNDEPRPTAETESASASSQKSEETEAAPADHESTDEADREAAAALLAMTNQPQATQAPAEETTLTEEDVSLKLKAAEGEAAAQDQPQQLPNELADETGSEPSAAAPQAERTNQPTETSHEPPPQTHDENAETDPTTTRASQNLQSEVATVPTGEGEPEPVAETLTVDEEQAGEGATQTAVESNQPTEARGDRDERHSRREKWYEGQSPSTTAAEPQSRATEASANRSSAAESGLYASAATPDAASTAASQPNSPPAAHPLDAAAPALAAAAVIAPTTPPLNSLETSESPLLRGATTEANASDANAAAPNSASNNRRTAQEAKANAPTQQASDLSQQERVRLVQRISRSFARLGPMGGQVNIKLHPPQLGSLNVQVRLEGRSMSAKLSTESAAARDAILESLPVLRSRLAEQGFEISQFQVEVADSRADSATGGNPQQQSFGQAGDGGGQTSRSQVDYRRLNAMQQQRQQNASGGAASPFANPLTWQTMAGLDLHA